MFHDILTFIANIFRSFSATLDTVQLQSEKINHNISFLIN